MVLMERLSEDRRFTAEKPAIDRAFNLFREFAGKGDLQHDLSRITETALIAVDEIHLGGKAVVCLVLKDIFDQRMVSEEEITDSFGKESLTILTGLKKIESLETKKFRSNTENFIRLLLTLSDDINVILIRLALQVLAMRHLGDYQDEKRRNIVDETALLYVPMAHRIGLYRIKTELEDRILAFRDPEVFNGIERRIRGIRKELDKYAVSFITPIDGRLKENGFTAEIRSRVKSVSSVWRKMQKQQVEFDKVYDLFAIRIILGNTVESEKSDCWKVYSLVTDIYQPNPKRLRDWTSFPKPNGYESLHATVAGPSGRWVEVQIRTKRMDDIAENGFAAHWKYKSGSRDEQGASMFAVIREMLENPEKGPADKVVSPDKKALYSDEIFIFTPQGDLKKLKAGYSVLDFAYEIHTQIGSACTGAVVNGKMVPLKQTLQNGDTVRILTSKNQKPNPGWLDIAKSPRTLARIKHALKMETYKDSEVGKEIIKHKLSTLGRELNDPVLNTLISAFGCEHVLDLYQKVGAGKIDPLRIKKVLTLPEPVRAVTRTEEPGFPERISEVLTGKEDFVIIDPSIRSIHYEFAKCCNPKPDHPIFAFVSVSQGIRIHRTKCKNAFQLVTKYPYRVLEAKWKETAAKEPKA